MRRARSLALYTLALGLFGQSAAALAQQPVNPLHPSFAPLDSEGQPTRDPLRVDATRTCGVCHDASFIASHDDHAQRTGATCIRCHMDRGRLEVNDSMIDPATGLLWREALRIGRPAAANCASCHGVVHAGTARSGPVALPDDLEAGAADPTRNLSLTLGEGAVFSPDRMADSLLNLKGKAARVEPWDVHAAKLLDCADCHYARNNPARLGNQRSRPGYLQFDPRRLSTSQYLSQPDHRLAQPACESCHDPAQTHDFLPHRARHMEVLACQSCHVPGPAGPSAKMIDATVALPGGVPAVVFRNLEREPGESLNAAYLRPMQPVFVSRPEESGKHRLAPANLVSRWRWVFGDSGEEVPFELVARAFFGESPKGSEKNAYDAAVLREFDANGDGQLDRDELRLDGPGFESKVALISRRLRALGVAEPRIEAELRVHPLVHGVAGREQAVRDCAGCHAGESKLAAPMELAAYVPAGVALKPREGDEPMLAGTIDATESGALVFRPQPKGLHVLGRTRRAASDRVGLALFSLVLMGVTVHAAGRLALRGRRAEASAGAGTDAAPEQVYVFRLYERIWHWIMALSAVVLMVTGVLIHLGVAGLPTAVSVHNVFAVVLMANAFLSLFYHLATAAIVQFFPSPKGLTRKIVEHLRYYSSGILFGAPRPRGGEKLNPLQQITYLALLNLLFPLQIGTGLAIWAVGRWPAAAEALGGLSWVAPLHSFGAWLFMAFFVLHLYLVTTGRTAGAHLKTMITGYETRDPSERES